MRGSSLLNKKIPTTVGLLLLAVAVLATSYLVNTGVIFFGGAAPSENPQEVRITNISDSSFTVTYKTEAKVIGTISVTDPDAKHQTILDERDQQSGIPKLYAIHSIAVKNLKPATGYAFSITSGATTYQNNGNPFSTKTAPALTASPSATTPLTGKLLGTNGTPPDEALVFITTTGGQSLSSLVKPDGVYIIPLNTMLTTDLASSLSLSGQTVMQLLATDGKNTSQAQVLLSGANPVPLMTLGSNYNFVAGTNPIASTAASLGFPLFPQKDTLDATEVITTPKKDESFTDAQPQFKGTALPNQTVTIEIHSDQVITATVKTDNFGNWTYRPTTPLSPGAHVLSITTKDASGILRTIQQSFTVFASGSQVTQSATLSGQLSPTPTNTSSGTGTPSPTRTITPTGIPLPTIKPTAGISQATPKPTLPPTGNNTLLFTSILGVASALVGAVLFVLTRGAAL